MALRVVVLRYVLMITCLHVVPKGYLQQAPAAVAGGTLEYDDPVLARQAARSIERMHGADMIVDVEEIEVEPEEDDGNY